MIGRMLPSPNRQPGNITHSRWLTTANNVMRLYVRTIEIDPSEGLKELATYVAKVYAPVWFAFKINAKCIYNAKNLWLLAKNSRNIKQEHLAVVDSATLRNAFLVIQKKICW